MICLKCAKPSKLRCPTCLKQGLKDSHYCSQECFKSDWLVHKKVHVSKTVYNPWPNYAYTGTLRPVYPLSPKRKVLSTIQCPDYANHPSGYSASEMSLRGSTKIRVLTPDEIDKMRVVAKVFFIQLRWAGKSWKLANVPLKLAPRPTKLTKSSTRNAWVICHGIPDQYTLKDGDICNLDISVYYDGFHSDLNETLMLGNVDENGVLLVNNARKCLDEAIKMVKPGVLYRNLGNTIQKVADADGFSVVKTYCGHGINSLFHSAPNVPHYAKNKAVGIMQPGHTFTIEPMISEGTWEDDQWLDGWTAVTRDGKRSAQFEETLLVTESGVEILTAHV